MSNNSGEWRLNRILIVDDEFNNRRLLRAILERYALCTDAPDGKEALRVFVNSMAVGQRFDLILLDIMMPGMNGHEVLERIRKIEAENQIHDHDTVKVIMVTALADAENVIEARRNLANGYILKPIRMQKVIEEIEKCAFPLKSKSWSIKNTEFLARHFKTKLQKSSNTGAELSLLDSLHGGLFIMSK